MKQPRATPGESRWIAQQAVRSMIAMKAEKICILDLRKKRGIADWFVIAGCDNSVMTAAVADAVERDLAQLGERSWRIEGREDGNWVLVDYVDVIVHVMLNDYREYYAIEELWEDCPREDFAAEPDGDVSPNPGRNAGRR